jgi:hypothetical protein
MLFGHGVVIGLILGVGGTIWLQRKFRKKFDKLKAVGETKGKVLSFIDRLKGKKP